MKALNIAVLCFWLLLSSASSADLTQSANDFALLDHAGKFHQLSYYGDQRGVVLYSHGVEYSGANSDIVRFEKLQSEYSDDQVVFFMINAFSQDSRDSIAEQMKNREARVSVLLDETQIVSRDLAITRLGEVLVIDAENRRVLHRGGALGSSQGRAWLIARVRLAHRRGALGPSQGRAWLIAGARLAHRRGARGSSHG